MCKTKYIIKLSLVLAIKITLSTQVGALHEHMCTEDDYTNDLPIFIEKRTICNYDSGPVPVYQIKTMPDTDYETKFCLKGESLALGSDFNSLSLIKFDGEILNDLQLI